MAKLLPNDFRELLKSLNESKVRYLLVGGYAVGQYGYPRATGAIDIWVASDASNAERIVEALRQFGFDLPWIKPELFIEPRNTIQLGYTPVRIDILTTISGVLFEECYDLREKMEIDGIPVDVIDLPNLIKNKRASGRHKDLDDIENLPEP